MAKKTIYAQVPAVPRKKIAGSNPMGTPTTGVGNTSSPMVPKKQAEVHGFNVPERTFKTAHVKGSKTYGHVAQQPQRKPKMRMK